MIAGGLKLKYIIELDDEPIKLENGRKYYEVKAAPYCFINDKIFNKLIPYEELSQSDEFAIQKAQEEVWAFAGFLMNTASNIVDEIYETTDDGRKGIKIALGMSYKDSKKKYKEWKKQKEELKIGDEVVFYKSGNPGIKMVITRVSKEGWIDGMDGKGFLYADKNPKHWKKTGRYFPEVVELIDKIKGD